MLQNTLRLDAPITGYVYKTKFDTVGFLLWKLSPWNLYYIVLC